MSDLQFANVDSWSGGGSGKFGLTFKEIVMMHLNRCVMAGSVEMCGGYWTEYGNPIQKIYNQDSRDVCNNSTRRLKALLLGYYDDAMKKADKKLKESFDKEHKKYSEIKNKTKEQKYEWKDFLTEHYNDLFDELVKLSKRLNFFEESMSSEDM